MSIENQSIIFKILIFAFLVVLLATLVAYPELVSFESKTVVSAGFIVMGACCGWLLSCVLHLPRPGIGTVTGGFGFKRTDSEFLLKGFIFSSLLQVVFLFFPFLITGDSHYFDYGLVILVFVLIFNIIVGSFFVSRLDVRIPREENQRLFAGFCIMFQTFGQFIFIVYFMAMNFCFDALLFVSIIVVSFLLTRRRKRRIIPG